MKNIFVITLCLVSNVLFASGGGFYGGSGGGSVTFPFIFPTSSGNGNGSAMIKCAGTGLKGPVADNTGLLCQTSGSVMGSPTQGDSIIKVNVDGQEMQRWEGVASGKPEMVMDFTTRPDCVTGVGGPCHLGSGSGQSLIRPWCTLFNRNILFGGDPGSQSFSTSASFSRALWYTHGGWSAGGYGDNTGIQTGNSLGFGFDAKNGNEWYLTFWDTALVNYVESFNVSEVGRTTTLSAPANTANDSTSGQTLVLKGGDKTGSGGNAGNLILSNATAASGLNGYVYVPAINGAITSASVLSGYVPMWYDSSTSNWCVRDGTTVKCTAMSASLTLSKHLKNFYHWITH